MRTFDKGTIIELEVQYLLVKQGYQVFTPVNEGCRVDLVFIDDNGATKKVQVKKSKPTSCGFLIELRYNINKKRTGKGFYSKVDVDYFATTFKGEAYLIPIEKVLGMSNIVLRVNEKYKYQKNNPLWASDYKIRV